MGFGGEFRLRLLDKRILDAAREAHPEWGREQHVLAALVSDTGWTKNVVTDLGRRFLLNGAWSAGFFLFLHRATNPANVRRTNLQFIYPNQTPLQARAPDSQTNDVTLLLQTRTTEFGVPSQSSVAGSKSLTVGPVQTLTDNGSGTFSADMVGNTITITGATNGTNNGTFPILSFISPTQITISNGAGVAETSSFSWTAGVTRIINIVGLMNGTVSNAQIGNRDLTGILAYTLLSSPVTQSPTQVADVQYRVSWSLD